MTRSIPKSQHGFTLVEMIIVIVITGIIGGMVAMFIRAPVQGYVDSARRAEMSDIADNALRRIARDVRTAVPNSIRLTAGSDWYFEFLPTKDGGRYRVNPGTGSLCGGAVSGNSLGDALDFDNADTCFEIIGTPVTFAAGDAIALGSTQSDGNSPYCKKTTCVVSGVTEPGTLRDYTGAAGAQLVVKMAGAAQFFTSTELEGHRFEVVPAGLPVTYACTGALALDVNGDGLGSLTRYSGYAISETQKAPAALGAGSILANNVSDCHFVYVTTNMSNSLLAIRLRITRGGENVNLYHEIHVNNIP